MCTRAKNHAQSFAVDWCFRRRACDDAWATNAASVVAADSRCRRCGSCFSRAVTEVEEGRVREVADQVRARSSERSS